MIDANSIIHRAFHALPPLTARGGRPIQAIYGLSSILLKLWREEKPDYAAALFDRPEPTFRKKEYAEYKAQRPPAPDDLISQIIEAHELFSRFSIKTFEAAGFEADDLIATLAEKFRSLPDLKIVVLTGDLDTLQIVEGDKVVVRTFKKGVSETLVYDEKTVKERYGLMPKNLIDYKALVGDPSDNIKGVPGIGPKTAAILIQKFGTVENLYKNLGKEPKWGKRLRPFKKEAEFSKNLVTLRNDAPISETYIEDLRTENQPDVSGYFEKMGFATLLKRFLDARSAKQEFQKKQDSQKSYQQSIFSSKDEPSQPARNFAESSVVAAKHDDKEIFILSGEESYRNDFESSKLKVGFGLKKLIRDLWRKGKELTPPYFDLGVAFWLLNPDFKNYGPDEISLNFLNRKWDGRPENLELALDYARSKLGESKLSKVFEEIEMPLLPILAEMENCGIAISLNRLDNLNKKLEKRLRELTLEIYDLAGGKFNINSPIQLQKILFEKLKLESRLAKKTMLGSRSTRAESLEIFRGQHPIISTLLQYRENFKLQSTYVRPIKDMVASDGRLHTEYIQTGTATGRLSSASPNLQNIPKESEWAAELRSAFVAQEGYSFLDFDYSQLELRILAALSGDGEMKRAFEKGVDIHRLTAARVLGISLPEVTETERRLAKTLNFGLIYGMGVASFAKTADLPREKAQKFIDIYFERFSEVRRWQEKVKNDARALGFTQTLTGRRRFFKGADPDSPQIRAVAERAAINHPVQGLGADILKMAMIAASNFLRKEGVWGRRARMILTIHDELLFEVSDDMMKKTAAAIKGIMENIFPLGVPLGVDISSGKNWGSLTKFGS